MASLAAGAREVARFAPLSARRPCDLAVASYNLLAPLYVRPVDERTGGVQPFAAFEWVADAHLAWEARRAALAAQIAAAAAAVDVALTLELRGLGATPRGSGAPALVYKFFDRPPTVSAADDVLPPATPAAGGGAPPKPPPAPPGAPGPPVLRHCARLRLVFSPRLRAYLATDALLVEVRTEPAPDP